MQPTVELRIWRHPMPIDAAGRCIGRTDLRVDPRRVRRLANRVLATVRREGLPREIWTSPLARCAQVGRALAHRGGFVHRIDARLAELDFGGWDGKPWSAITADDIAQWESDFSGLAPGGGESLRALIARVEGFVRDCAARSAGSRPVLIVGHAGWIGAAHWVGRAPPSADRWPVAIAYGASTRIRIELAPDAAGPR